jgi:rare lipoprotein A
MTKLTLTLFFVMLLSACSTSRYSHKHDSAPTRPPTVLELEDATVTTEKVGRGNSPYSIKGIRYVPKKNRKAFTQTGTASWYGRKFHGHLTSNGEIYNMYQMSAAHKTLPLPSFVKVTNLANNKSTIVRVNDRGPFYEDRIIDLSYSAAYKIGVYDTGTANVKLEVVFPESVSKPEPKQTAKVDNLTQNQTKAENFHVKISGIESIEHAEEVGKGLSIMLNQTYSSVQSNNDVALLFGPFDNQDAAENFSNQLSDVNYNKSIIKNVLP